MAEPPLLPGHRLLGILRETQEQWLLQVEVEGLLAVTRVLKQPVAVEAGAAVSEAVWRGASAESLPWAVRQVVEGYRARARSGGLAGLPEVIAAGAVPTGDGRAVVFLTRRWIAGRDLEEALPDLDHDERRTVAVAVAERVAELHAAGLAVQDLKPSNLVVGAAGDVHLIDLESLRAVDASTGLLSGTHYSEGYAAPELVARLEGGLRADVWSLGLVLQELLADPPPVVGRCVAAVPERRPSASEVAAALRGEGDGEGGTVRVPEPTERTVRVGEPAQPQVELAPIAPPTGLAPPARRARAAVATVLAVGLGVLAVASAGAVHLGATALDRISRAQAAAAQLEVLRANLARHKTVAAANTAEVLAEVVERAEDLVADAAAPEAATGVLALATVWAQRWHFHGATWDPVSHAALDDLTARAAVAGTAEGLLARGLYSGARCRLGPEDGAREQACVEAAELLEDAGLEAAGWLEVEARWGQVSVGLAVAQRGAHGALERALAACDAAAPLLSQAPVNGVELVQDCLLVAGLSRDPAAWSGWGRWLVERDEQVRGAVSTSTVARLSTTALPRPCGSVALTDVGLPVVGAGGGAAAACRVAALGALGCRREAERARRCARSWLGVCVRYVEAPGVPWSEILRAGRALPDRRCSLPDGSFDAGRLP